MKLIIVESPTKARTLSRFLGKDYQVEATVGHVKDLPKSKLGIDIEKNFKPDYIEVAAKQKYIKKIKSESKKAKEIFLATDPDREGEAIAQHIKEIINGDKTKRIVFHEITKRAVENAIKSPGKVNKNLVDAQIGRRVLDRLVGYKLSPLLWRKVRRGLSAGRVQTVTVRLIVEKEREIEKFKRKEYWEIYCTVKSKKDKFSVKLVKIGEKKAEVSNKNESSLVVSDLKKSDYEVSNVVKREIKRNPYPPFTTSTLSQFAARMFYWSAKRTMSIAQKLYEEGLITYHRTDSTYLSKQAVSRVRSYIEKVYGNQYLPDAPRFYKTKAKVAQEAHEAIRPTKVKKTNDKMVLKSGLTNSHRKLYDLIWKRFVACQMNPSIYDETKIEVIAKNKKEYLLRVSGQIMKFDGWRKLFTSKNSTNNQLPNVNKGDRLDLVKVDSDQKFTEPPPRYGEASLIKTLEKLGIGRPSTYAPIISTIQIRNYVEKNEGKFKPTPVGITVNDFLIMHFPSVFEYSFTAKMEDDLDKVANGKAKWTKEIGEFWNPFEKKLEKVTEKSKRVKIETEKVGKKCATCKKGDLVIRIGRFGKFISCSSFPDCKHTEKYIEKIGIKCLDCKKGDVIVRLTKKRRKFYGCSRYPDCKWASWRKPKILKKSDPAKTI